MYTGSQGYRAIMKAHTAAPRLIAAGVLVAPLDVSEVTWVLKQFDDAVLLAAHVPVNCSLRVAPSLNETKENMESEPVYVN